MAEVRVAKSAGFCYGVERAVKLAKETAREKGGGQQENGQSRDRFFHWFHSYRLLTSCGALQQRIRIRLNSENILKDGAQ